MTRIRRRPGQRTDSREPALLESRRCSGPGAAVLPGPDRGASLHLRYAIQEGLPSAPERVARVGRGSSVTAPRSRLRPRPPGQRLALSRPRRPLRTPALPTYWPTATACRAAIRPDRLPRGPAPPGRRLRPRSRPRPADGHPARVGTVAHDRRRPDLSQRIERGPDLHVPEPGPGARERGDVDEDGEPPTRQGPLQLRPRRDRVRLHMAPAPEVFGDPVRRHAAEILHDPVAAVLPEPDPVAAAVHAQDHSPARPARRRRRRPPRGATVLAVTPSRRTEEDVRRRLPRARAARVRPVDLRSKRSSSPPTEDPPVFCSTTTPTRTPLARSS